MSSSSCALKDPTTIKDSPELKIQKGMDNAIKAITSIVTRSTTGFFRMNQDLVDTFKFESRPLFENLLKIKFYEVAKKSYGHVLENLAIPEPLPQIDIEDEDEPAESVEANDKEADITDNFETLAEIFQDEDCKLQFCASTPAQPKLVIKEPIPLDIPRNSLDIPSNSLDIPSNSLDIPSNSLDIPSNSCPMISITSCSKSPPYSSMPTDSYRKIPRNSYSTNASSYSKTIDYNFSTNVNSYCKTPNTIPYSRAHSDIFSTNGNSYSKMSDESLSTNASFYSKIPKTCAYSKTAPNTCSTMAYSYFEIPADSSSKTPTTFPSEIPAFSCSKIPATGDTTVSTVRNSFTATATTVVTMAPAMTSASQTLSSPVVQALTKVQDGGVQSDESWINDSYQDDW